MMTINTIYSVDELFFSEDHKQQLSIPAVFIFETQTYFVPSNYLICDAMFEIKVRPEQFAMTEFGK
jgi:hypothetical protein